MVDTKLSALTERTTPPITTTGVKVSEDIGGTPADKRIAATLLLASHIITDATTTRTLALTDAGAYIRCTSGSATTVTVPPNSSVAFPTGTEVNVRAAGAGQVTIAQGAGVTINSAETLKLRKQGSTGTIKKVATDTWDLMGDLEASP